MTDVDPSTNVDVTPPATGGSTPTEVDTFDDGDVSEYTGDTASATVQSATAYSGEALELNQPTTSNVEIISTTGLNAYPAPGDTFEFRVLFPVGGGSDAIFYPTFAYQDANNYYRVTLEGNANDLRIGAVVAGNATTLDSTNFNPQNYEGEWLRVEVEWAASGWITVKIEQDDGTVLAVVTGQDSNHGEGGITFETNSGSASDFNIYADEWVIL